MFKSDGFPQNRDDENEDELPPYWRFIYGDDT